MDMKLREDWMNRLAEMMRPWFEAHTHPLPAFRASCGFPSTGRKGKRIGECWSDASSADAHHEIFIHPSQSDSMEVAAILAHELIHAAVGLSHKHAGEFKKTALAIGLEGKMKATYAGEAFKQFVSPFLESLGDYPHAALASAGNSSKDPKQTVRMLKVICPACGYLVRTTQKWVEMGMPVCPCGETMEME